MRIAIHEMKRLRYLSLFERTEGKFPPLLTISRVIISR
jgi:hypothetical protein